MSTIGPIVPPLRAPLLSPLSPGLPWQASGGPSLLKPPAISDLAAPTGVTIGGTLTWTAAPGSTSTQLYRDGVASGTVTTGYTLVAADIGPVLDVRGVNAAGTGPASNTVQFTVSPTNLVGDYNFESASYYTLVSGRLSAALDQSGASHDIVQAAAGRRAAIAVAGSPSGRDAADFASLAGAATALHSADIGITSAVVSIVAAFTMPATGLTMLDGFVSGKHQLFTDTPGLSLKMYTGAVGPTKALVQDTWYGGSFVFNGASSFMRIGQTAVVTADAGSNTGTGIVLGSSASEGVASGTKVARCLVYNAALTQAQTLDLNAYLTWRYGV